MSEDRSNTTPWRHPRAAAIVHSLLGPPIASVFAFLDAVGDSRREFGRVYRRSYVAIRSNHADKWESARFEKQRREDKAA